MNILEAREQFDLVLSIQNGKEYQPELDVSAGILSCLL